MINPEKAARVIARIQAVLDDELGRDNDDLRKAWEERDRLRELLREASDAIPIYADGRYDELFDAIDAALGEPQDGV